MTNQEIFDKVARHLLAQGELSTLCDMSTRAYRGVDGRMCAVGCLIMDEHYDPELEGRTVVSEPVLEALELSGVDVDYALLTKLQWCHDRVLPALWRKHLALIASNCGLSWPEGL